MRSTKKWPWSPTRLSLKLKPLGLGIDHPVVLCLFVVSDLSFDKWPLPRPVSMKRNRSTAIRTNKQHGNENGFMWFKFKG
jgi:hypothetical protein